MTDARVSRDLLESVTLQAGADVAARVSRDLLESVTLQAGADVAARVATLILEVVVYEPPIAASGGRRRALVRRN